MAMTSSEWRKAMNREYYEDDLIDLGTASVETKGGPMGYEDSERTLWLHSLSLTDD
jgi:hypothetical protein